MGVRLGDWLAAGAEAEALGVVGAVEVSLTGAPFPVPEQPASVRAAAPASRRNDFIVFCVICLL